jgi:lipid-binding SYLF domain-containing protein
MASQRLFLATSLLVLAPFVQSVSAKHQIGHHREINTVNASIEVVHDFAEIPLKFIPPHLLREAKGVAIFPHVVKAGLLIDKRFGKGLVMVREPNGSWSAPVFVAMEGTGIGLQAGVESTDLVLIFKNPKSLERILQGKGKLTLGTDVSIAAGPIGREAETATDGHLKADVLSYSRSRGLFAGVSMEGARVNVDPAANANFYGRPGCQPEDVLLHRFEVIPAAESLKREMTRVSMSPE